MNTLYIAFQRNEFIMKIVIMCVRKFLDKNTQDYYKRGRDFVSKNVRFFCRLSIVAGWMWFHAIRSTGREVRICYTK